MEDNNALFEWMLHIMEFSMLAGIGVVVWLTRKLNQEKQSETQSQSRDNQNINSHIR